MSWDKSAPANGSKSGTHEKKKADQQRVPSAIMGKLAGMGYDAARKALSPDGQKGVKDSVTLFETLSKLRAYRDYNPVTQQRPKNKSGNYRGMVKNKNAAGAADKAAKVGDVLKIASRAPGAMTDAKEGMSRVNALSANTEMGVMQSTAEFGKIIVDEGSDAAGKLLGLDDTKAEVLSAMKQVDALSQRRDIGVGKSTLEFGKIIGSAGTNIAAEILSLEEAKDEVLRSLSEVDELSRRTDIGVARSTWEFAKIIGKGGVNAASEILGLADAKDTVVEAVMKVDEVSSQSDLGTFESTWKFAKTITKGGTKAFLQAVPGLGAVGDKIDV